MLWPMSKYLAREFLEYFEAASGPLANVECVYLLQRDSFKKKAPPKNYAENRQAQRAWESMLGLKPPRGTFDWEAFYSRGKNGKNNSELDASNE